MRTEPEIWDYYKSHEANTRMESKLIIELLIDLRDQNKLIIALLTAMNARDEDVVMHRR